MRSAAQVLYKHIGSPPVDKLVPAEGRCWVCGGELSQGKFWSDWAGANFVGQNRVKAPESEYVCPACVYLCSRLSPVPGRPPKEGKKLGGNFRNYSHLFDQNGYVNASKAEKRTVLAWLRSGHTGSWFAAIADSGQKHLLPWAPINPDGTPRGVVLFEEQLVVLPVAAGWGIVDGMVELLSLGVSKEELSTGQYTSANLLSHAGYLAGWCEKIHLIAWLYHENRYWLRNRSRAEIRGGGA